MANIDRALAAADPADAAVFQANLAAYTKQLQVLDAEVQRQIDSLANKKLVTNHDAFGYYIDRYGLQFVGSVIPSFDSSAELSGRDIRDLVAKVRATGVKAIFSETTSRSWLSRSWLASTSTVFSARSVFRLEFSSTNT